MHRPRPPAVRRAAGAALPALVLTLALVLAVAVPPAAALPGTVRLVGRSSDRAAEAWAWPLSTSGGRPVMLRRASIPARTWQAGHRGVDLAAAVGQAVLAPVDGVVVTASPVAGRGVVSIRAASGWRATLEPVAAEVAVGQVVRRGQRVGTLAAGTHCGPVSCLHWGVRSGSGGDTVYRDPLALLRRQVVLLPVPGWSGGRTGVSWPRTASRASP